MYDVVFISYNEPDCEQRFTKLKDRVLYIKRVHGVKGIHNAHKQAALICQTPHFFVIDGDADVLDNYDFNFKVEHDDMVYIWNSVNPLNGLQYGYGGVKLLPRKLTSNMDLTTIDMTTSISNNLQIMDQVSNITAFNTDPFNTWKSAFRECAKLSSKVIDRQDDGETNERLKIWTTKANGRFSEYAIRGANAGMQFGLSNSSDIHLINNFEWLENEYKK
jgi:hypothetical protein